MILLVLTLLGLTPTPTTVAPSQLELENFWHISSEERFDLSGVVALNDEIRKSFGLKGDVLLVNDRAPIIYEGTFQGNEIHIQPWQTLGELGKTDFEDIAIHKNTIYVANEYPPSVYVLNMVEGKINTLIINFSEALSGNDVAMAMTPWFGIEGIAVTDSFIFLAKEMPVFGLFRFERDQPLKGKLETLRPTTTGSQTSLRVTDGIYTLNRETKEIVKMNSQLEPQAHFSFKKTLEDPRFNYICKDSEGKVHDEWSTAEALEFTDNQIWIGLDNNGETLKAGKESRAVLLGFKRPKDF